MSCAQSVPTPAEWAQGAFMEPVDEAWSLSVLPAHNSCQGKEWSLPTMNRGIRPHGGLRDEPDCAAGLEPGATALTPSRAAFTLPKELSEPAVSSLHQHTDPGLGRTSCHLCGTPPRTRAQGPWKTAPPPARAASEQRNLLPSCVLGCSAGLGPPRPHSAADQDLDEAV